MIKTAKHPNGQTIDFSEDNHQYTDDTGRSYLSCTTLIHNFFPKFDEHNIATKYAKKNKLNIEDVKREWRKNGEEAANFGTRIHAFAEAYLKNEPLPEPASGKETLYFKGVERFIKGQILPFYKLIEMEKIIFSPTYGVAGTVDLILKDRKGRVIICDWKTNKEIKQENKYQEGLDFLSHLDDCNYNHYCLQLNTYRKLLETEGYYRNMKNAEMKLFHVSTMKVTTYDLPSMEKEVNSLLDSQI